MSKMLKNNNNSWTKKIIGFDLPQCRRVEIKQKEAIFKQVTLSANNALKFIIKFGANL